MNDNPNPAGLPDERMNAFLPLVLVAVSLALVFLFQLSAITQQRKAFRDAIANQENAVQQSRQLQTNLEKLVRDLLDLSQTDNDAKAVKEKYGIQMNAPAGVPALTK